jgi:hypothetical protein
MMTTEGSLISRYVVFLTPPFSTAAGYLVKVIDDATGAQLDGAQLTCLMVTSATSAAVASWKWLTGWQQHERLVADGLAEPRKPAVGLAQKRSTHPYARRRRGFTLVTEIPPGTTVPRAPRPRT